jgi:hypothetical protein
LNNLQSLGLFTPRKMAGHSQDLTSRLCFSLMVKRASASKSANVGRIARRALQGYAAQTAPFKGFAQRKTSSIILRPRVARIVTTREYWFSTSHRPSFTCRISISTDCSTSRGLKPGDHHRPPILRASGR